MANFYNSNNILTSIAYEFPCEYDELSLKGLKEGEILVSYNPSFIQNSNGIVVGIDSRFTKFYVLNSNRSILKVLELNWINDCSKVLSEIVESKTIRNDYSIAIILGFVFIILIIKTFRRKYESH